MGRRGEGGGGKKHRLGSSRKYPYPYHGWHFGIPNAWGVLWPGIPNARGVAGIGILIA